MFKRIHALSEEVVRQIAAGEVVERPASVVKELIENSIDAESRHITLEIKGNGKEMIRIADDGCGMSPEDAVLALERHTTSKISSANDLENLSTFGFRGEALPSISSISKMELSTRLKNEPAGTIITLEGGKIIHQKECGRDFGTTIDVKSLFFNTPARLKFLKSDGTERSKILNTFEETAMAHPQIAFSLKDGSSSKSRQKEFPARKTLLERMTDFWGENFTEETLFPISVNHPYIKVEGWLSKPESHQSSKFHQIFYVNKRPILSRSLSHALYESYRDCLPVGRHPAAVIFITLDPAQVDVNVHPSKREVRFRNESQIHETLIREIRLKRTQLSGTPKILVGFKVPSNSQSVQAPQEVPWSKVQTEIPNWNRKNFPSFGQGINSPLSSSDSNTEFSQSNYFQTESAESSAVSEQTRTLAQFNFLYILAEKEGNLLIVDQHAAGERILYEKFKKALESEKSVQTQMLLIPLIWNISLSQTELLKNLLPTFHKLGFILEIFGEKTFRITEVPASIPESGLKNALEEILYALENQNQVLLTPEEKIMRAACRAAVKSNDHLSHKECTVLLEKLFKCDNPHTCPHGRPTMLTMTRHELDKKFGRV